MKEIKKIIEENFKEAKNFLKELIEFKSISGVGEEEIQNFIYEKFKNFGDCKQDFLKGLQKLKEK